MKCPKEVEVYIVLSLTLMFNILSRALCFEWLLYPESVFMSSSEEALDGQQQEHSAEQLHYGGGEVGCEGGQNLGKHLHFCIS